MMQKTVQFIQKEPVIWGPLFLLCTLALAMPLAIPYDLVTLAAGGFFLSARYQIRGCCYAFVLLALFSALRHAFFVTDHLWQLGIEGSIGLSFFITALAFEKGALWINSLESQIETRKSALQNLEEEFAKTRESVQEQQIAFQEKVAGLQKEFEELQLEHSSILILNEVLRKTSARHNRESADAQALLHDAKTQIDALRKELVELEKETVRIKNSEALVLENKELMKELNQARFDKEQTHLINETLARQHIKELLKAKDAESEAISLKEQLQAAHQEIRRIEDPLKEKLEAAKREAQLLKNEFEKTTENANKARAELLKLHEIQSERNFLKERLESAMLELSQQKPKVDPNLLEKLKFAEEKIVHLSQIEPLFKQLKNQFEEKNQILHQTRSDLFKSDTELQKLKIENAAFELNPLPKEVENELDILTERLGVLEEENGILQELVTHLSNLPEPKKKVKKGSAPNDQTLLF